MHISICIDVLVRVPEDKLPEGCKARYFKFESGSIVNYSSRDDGAHRIHQFCGPSPYGLLTATCVTLKGDLPDWL